MTVYKDILVNYIKAYSTERDLCDVLSGRRVIRYIYTQTDYLLLTRKRNRIKAKIVYVERGRTKHKIYYFNTRDLNIASIY